MLHDGGVDGPVTLLLWILVGGENTVEIFSTCCSVIALSHTVEGVCLMPQQQWHRQIHYPLRLTCSYFYDPYTIIRSESWCLYQTSRSLQIQQAWITSSIHGLKSLFQTVHTSCQDQTNDVVHITLEHRRLQLCKDVWFFLKFTVWLNWAWAGRVWPGCCQRQDCVEEQELLRLMLSVSELGTFVRKTQLQVC